MVAGVPVSLCLPGFSVRLGSEEIGTVLHMQRSPLQIRNGNRLPGLRWLAIASATVAVALWVGLRGSPLGPDELGGTLEVARSASREDLLGRLNAATGPHWNNGR